MILWLDRLHDLVVPFLLVLATLLASMFTWLIAWRTGVQLHTTWRRQVMARYRPLVGELVGPSPAPDVMERLSRSPRRYRDAIGTLILDALRLTTGEIVPRLRDAAGVVGLVDRWRAGLHDRHWWVRAESVRALGLVRELSVVDTLIAALDDPHDEVRAAAVDALGRIGDDRAVPALLGRLPDESRHQRARLVEAVRRLGPSVVPALVAYAQAHPGDAALAIEVLGVTGGTGALEHLLAWTGADEPAVRVAALQAVGSIGLDERSYYYALRALDDPDPDVRGMAARALGRSGRRAAVPYLAAHLNDEWIVAAQAAAGLRRLGRDGALALRAQRDAPGQAGVLARQMIWELTALEAA